LPRAHAESRRTEANGGAVSLQLLRRFFVRQWEISNVKRVKPPQSLRALNAQHVRCDRGKSIHLVAEVTKAAYGLRDAYFLRSRAPSGRVSAVQQILPKLYFHRA
jgi:hypothetical protein